MLGHLYNNICCKLNTMIGDTFVVRVEASSESIGFVQYCPHALRVSCESKPQVTRIIAEEGFSKTIEFLSDHDFPIATIRVASGEAS